MKKVFKYVTEITLAYFVLEPLHFSCKIDEASAMREHTNKLTDQQMLTRENENITMIDRYNGR